MRPFASGEVSISDSSILAFALILVGSVLASTIGMYFVLVLGGYYLITLGYSLFLKRKVVIDICILATLCTIRIVAGGASTGLDLSVWLIAFSIFFFLSLGSVKRQSELVDLSKRGETNAEGRGYQATDLPIMLNISLSSGYISILVLALYINSPNVIALAARQQCGLLFCVYTGLPELCLLHIVVICMMIQSYLRLKITLVSIVSS